MRRIQALTLVLFAAGCASVPKDAPDELQSADRSIKDADQADADNYAPKTMKAAKAKLSDSVKTFEESKKGSASLDDSKQEARVAKQYADNALTLTNELKAADGGDLQAMVDQKQAASDLAAAKAALQNAQAKPVVTAPGATMTEGVAYFETGKAGIDEKRAPALAQIVDSLKNNPDTHIKLTGRADHRGTEALNEPLSQNRAQAVAKYLEDQGIATDRITVQGIGAKDAAEVSDPGLLQLDRRVDAEMTNLAH